MRPGSRFVDLLQHPAVAVGIAERGVGAVAVVIGRGSGSAVVRTGVAEPAHGPRCAVEHVAHFDPACRQIVVSCVDVGHDEEQGPARTGLSRGEVGAELD